MPREIPHYPMVQCLDGRHPPFNIEQHPNGCPAHLAALSDPRPDSGIEALTKALVAMHLHEGMHGPFPSIRAEAEFVLARATPETSE